MDRRPICLRIGEDKAWGSSEGGVVERVPKDSLLDVLWRIDDLRLDMRPDEDYGFKVCGEVLNAYAVEEVRKVGGIGR